MSRPAPEVADIFRDHGPAWRTANAGHVSLGQLKVMAAIESRYETLEERRAAMIAKGWAPSAVAALEEAMQPKFLRDMRRREEERMKVVEGVVDEVVEKVGESETERHEET